MDFNILYAAPTDFNSIKVQLERNAFDLSYSNKFNFNSIKVQLELKKLMKFRFVIAFQFHKGTIRTDYFVSNKPFSFEFQFHKGTIRTLLILKGIVLLRYFNSIKVQLEHPFYKGNTKKKLISIP